MAGSDTELVFASIADDGPLDRLDPSTCRDARKAIALRQFRDADAALEWCEDELLAGAGLQHRDQILAERRSTCSRVCQPEECRLVEAIVRPLVFEKGDVIMREGDPAKLFFVLARGTVSVQIKVHGKGGRQKRVASIGPGLTFGEMALLDGGKRSADVIAERAGDLLRARGRGAARAGRRASQHHDHHSQQSDARILRAPAPRQ